MKLKTPQPKEINVADLDFDPRNPRFPEDIAALPNEDLIERFIRDERLLELVSSIADQGYFQGEPLLVVKDQIKNKYIVIEGNRRLAALKLLHHEIEVPEGRITIEQEVENAANRPDPIPCLVFSEREEILRYLGFRHITGIKSWGALQKARYLKQIRDTLYADKEGIDQTRALAREIGSRPDYVGQILTALHLYQLAEAENFYEVPGLFPNNIEFSLLSTAISYSTISEYVGLENRQDMHSSTVKKEHLKNLMIWLFASPDGHSPVLGESRNLRKLAAILGSEQATYELKKSNDLESAYLLSEGPSVAFEKTIQNVLSQLKQTWATFPSLDSIEDRHIENLREIRKFATSLIKAANDKLLGDDDDE